MKREQFDNGKTPTLNATAATKMIENIMKTVPRGRWVQISFQAFIPSLGVDVVYVRSEQVTVKKP